MTTRRPWPDDAGEVFMVKARRCKRCGGLLTSAQAVADGYGHVCKMKELGEKQAKDPIPGQMDLLGEGIDDTSSTANGGNNE